MRRRCAQGQEWGDDFSLYVATPATLPKAALMRTRAMCTIRPIPLYRRVLIRRFFRSCSSPIYLVFGMNLLAMKVFVVLFSRPCWVYWPCCFTKRLPPYVLGCLALFALNPYVWQHKDRLLSETPFMLFAYLSLLLAEKAQEEPERRRGRVGLACRPGCLPGVRYADGRLRAGSQCSPGDWLWRAGPPSPQRPSRQPSSPASLLRSVYWLSKGVIWISSSSILPCLQTSRNPWCGRWGISSRTATVMLLDGSCLSACWHRRVGRISRGLRSRAIGCELFALFNFLVLVVWPCAESDRRFLLPILPLFFFWAAEGLHRLESTAIRRLAMPAAIALALAVLLSYAGWYRCMEFGPIRDGVGSPQAARCSTGYSRKRMAAGCFCFPGRGLLRDSRDGAALAHHPADDPERLAHTLTKHGVTHLVVYHSSPFPIFQRSDRLVRSAPCRQAVGLRHGLRKRGFPRLSHPRGIAGFPLTPAQTARRAGSRQRPECAAFSPALT